MTAWWALPGKANRTSRWLTAQFEAGPVFCKYCGRQLFSRLDATVDHVIPRSLGGRDRPSNYVAACHPCNTGKGSKLLGFDP